MTKKRLEKAFDAYEKDGDVKAMGKVLRDLVLYMARDAKEGYAVEFLAMLPFVVEKIKALTIK
jgi:uncharacterized protein (DUF934 family)